MYVLHADCFVPLVVSSCSTKPFRSNFYGQTGNSTWTSNSNIAYPTIVPGLSSGILSIGAGGYHSCAVLQGASPTEGASAVCWGKNDYGQLGDGSTQMRIAPVLVSGLSFGVASLAAGFTHSCAQMINGSVFCWGYNENGQLGLGYLSTREVVPKLVAGLPSRAVSVAAGGYHTCALLDSGAVMCWGRCQEAQIGDNSVPCPTNQYTKTLPNLVFGLAAGSGVIKISAGRGHTCAVMSNGSAVCWGGAAPSCLCSSILPSYCRRQPIWADGRHHSGFSIKLRGFSQACSWFCSGRDRRGCNHVRLLPHLRPALDGAANVLGLQHSGVRASSRFFCASQRKTFRLSPCAADNLETAYHSIVLTALDRATRKRLKMCA